MHVFRHLHTVCKHRRQVRRNCFKAGLIWQGLTHDLSKFSSIEFWRGAKYYQGTRSPQAQEREVFGYSSAWLHHKGRNKHHFEYWTDVGKDGTPVCVEMPAKYLAEMVCDRIAASKVYNGKSYTDRCPLEYYLKRRDKAAMHPKTSEQLEYFLTTLAEKGEKEMFGQLKAFVKENKKKNKSK